ncbi:M14 metallopeptidase family protein [Gemmatimonadota bacterium]
MYQFTGLNRSYRSILLSGPLCILLLLALTAPRTMAQTLQAPEEFLGFPVGADNKLAHWDQIFEYMQMASESSDRIMMEVLGKSTLGRDFPLMTITSGQNMQNLDRLKDINRRLYNPESVTSEAEAQRLIDEGKVVVFITCAIHASEIGSTQMVLELVHRLATENSPYIQNILDNVIFLLVPSLNPDGQAMEVDWFNQTFGTEYEGAGLPWLYHHYTGHDNNRDAYMFTQVETQMIGKVLYHDWFPEVWLDEHQMGASGARIFIMPAAGPPNPNVDPWIYRTAGLLGFAQAQALDEEGKSGSKYGEQYTYWWEGAMAWTGWWHNMVGMLSELASARNMASPSETPIAGETPPAENTEQPAGARRGGGGPPRDLTARPEYLNPWRGGRWSLRDIVDYESIITFALLDACADMRENMLSGIWAVNKRTVEKGKAGNPSAVIIPVDQHDNPTAVKLLQVLNMGGLKIDRATSAFTADGVDYPAGTWVIPMAQVFRNYAKDLLEPQVYPTDEAPYDVTGWSLGMQMGVETIFVNDLFDYEGESVGAAPMPAGTITGRGNVFLFDSRNNDSFTAALRLLRAGHTVGRSSVPVEAGDTTLPAGTFVVSGSRARADVETAAAELGLTVRAVSRARADITLARAPRVALYQPWGGNMNEGWTRYVLDTFEWEPITIHPEDIRDQSNLAGKYDVILFPDTGLSGIMQGQTRGIVMPQYQGGIEDSGLQALKEFVGGGGTIVMLGQSTQLAIDEFGAPFENALTGDVRQNFSCPGSILEVIVDASNSVGWGMPQTANIMYGRDLLFRLTSEAGAAATGIVMQFGDENPLKSGWIQGPEYIFGAIGAASFDSGDGHLVLLPVRVQRRAQTHGIFKLLFNPLMNSVGR